VISDGSAFTTSIQLCGKILAEKVKTKLLHNPKIFLQDKSKVIAVHTMKALWWSGGIAPVILNLSTRWR
jgi:hypothetical protein